MDEGDSVRFLFLAAVLIVAARAWGEGALPAPAPSPAPADSVFAAPAGEVDPGLARVFSSVDSAWRSADALLLSPHIGRRGAGLSLAGEMTEEGWFSRNQALSLLDRLLRSSETVRFDFVRYRNLAGGAGRPNAAAVWDRRRGRDALIRQVLFLSLAREEGRWVIAELKTKDEGAAAPAGSREADR
jgi:hypothetical protein